jgi:hypothetical protein
MGDRSNWTHQREIRVAWRQYRKLMRRAARYATWNNKTWVPSIIEAAEKIKAHALDLERLDATTKARWEP